MTQQSDLAASWFSYLPHYLCQELILEPDGPLLEKSQRFSAVTLFADISGFTPLSELLSKQGKAGTEKLTHLLNSYFAPVIALIQSYGGIIVKFGGDAMTVIFPCEASQPAETARRAVTCAWAIRQIARQTETWETELELAQFNLTMKVGLGAGEILTANVGNPAARLEYIIAGSGIATCIAAEQQAKQGEVICHKNLWAILDAHEVEIKATAHPDFSYLQAVKVPAMPQPLSPLDFEAATNPVLIEKISAYLHPVIAERLKRGQLGFINEHRKVTILFTGFGGFDYEKDSQVVTKLQDYLLKVIESVQEYGGHLAKVDVGDTGSQYILVFGAPVAFEDDEERAVRCALKLQEIADAAGLPTRTGLHTGLVYCGQVGSSLRQEYTVIGDAVNLATRLMQAAQPGQILVSESCRRATAELFRWENLAPIQVKGKQEAVSLSRLVGMLEPSTGEGTLHLQAMHYNLPMIGRVQELQLIAEKLELALAGRGQIVGISGEAGIGKSRLLAEVIKLVQAKQLTGYGGECQSYGTNIPYLAWQSFWRAFFGLDKILDAPPESQLQHLHRELLRLDHTLMPRLPLLEAVLNLPIPDNELTASFEARFRKEALENMLADCLKARAKSAKLFLVLEDCHWLDPLSQDLLDLIAGRIGDLPVFLVLAYRPPAPENQALAKLERLDYFSSVVLQTFSPPEAAHLVHRKLEKFLTPPEVQHVPEMLIQALIERAAGNPFYIEELVNYLHDKQTDLTTPNSLDGLALPDSLQSLVLSRIDQLNEAQKATLKVASVIGRLFKASWLWGVYPLLGEPEQVKANLRQLDRLDITPLERSEPELEYLFKHIIIQDVAYESLTFATRTLLHEQVGTFIEQNYAQSLSEWTDLLAYHYSRSTNLAKQKYYLRLAGEAAQAAYANLAALNYYEKLVPLLNDAEQLEIKLKIGKVLDLVGRWNEAFAVYEQVLNEAQRLERRDFEARAQKALGTVRRNQGQHQEALQWLEQARQTFKALNDYAGVSQALIETGEIHAIKWELELAKVLLGEGLSIARRLNDLQATSQSLYHLGTIANFQGNYTAAQALLEESLNLRRTLNDKGGLALCLNNLGNIAGFRGEYEKAQAYYEESLTIHREMGSKQGVAMVRHNLGLVSTALFDFEAAAHHFAESMALHRQTGNKLGIATVLNSQGILTVLQGDYERAGQLIGESKILSTELKNKWGQALIYTHLGFLEYKRGNYKLAGCLYEESLEIRRELKDNWGVAHTLAGLMGVLAALPLTACQAQVIARLGGSVQTLIKSTGLALRPFFWPVYEQALKSAADLLGSLTYATEFSTGESLTLEKALEYALANQAFFETTD